MADEGVRKSSRIKSRSRTIYTEDDFDYEMHFDVSNDISNILGSHSQQKNKDGFGTKKKSNGFVSKKVGKVQRSGHQSVKPYTGNDQRAFGDVIVNTSDVGSNASSIVDVSMACSICSKPFASEKALEEHMVQHQSEDGKIEGCFVCDICSKICVDQLSYTRHMNIHSDDRKFKCDICDKAFIDSCSLKRHVKSHRDERPCTCDLCFKSFRDNPSLIRHQMTHTDRPRMFQCLTCDKNFVDKHSLKRHERTHTGLRPFECKICFKTFSEAGSFKRHLKTHSGLRRFSCHVCNKGFLEKQSLVRHQKNVCGFDDTIMSGSASFQGADRSHDSRDTENSEISQASVDDGASSFLNDNSLTSDCLNSPTSSSSATQPKNVLGSVAINTKTSTSTEKSEIHQNQKDAPSLHSLMLKDPKLYDSISEIVDSIDSYEKMLDLCGETGQGEIDAALTRKHVPMPDNILCFECGELLVNGENFKGNNFQPNLSNSYKCLNCDDGEDTEYGEPPVLTAEAPIDGLSSSNGEKFNNGSTDECLIGNQEEKPKSVKDGLSKNIFGTDESLEHLRERLRIQHGVAFFGDAYDGSGGDEDDDDDGSDTNDIADRTCSNATTSRSHSPNSEVVQATVVKQSILATFIPKENLACASKDHEDIHPDVVAKNSSIILSTSEGQQGVLASTSVTPKMDYEVDDQNIPVVFPCHLCTKVFATSAFLSRHLDLHKNSPHKCMVCGKTFTNSQSLKRHMTTHTGEKPYTCPHCHKRFRDPSNFCKHKKVCSTTLSVPSPGDSVLSTSSVSSLQSLDESTPTDRIGEHIVDLKPKLAIPSHSSTTNKVLMPHHIPLGSSYDKDEDEDLPVQFAHPPETLEAPVVPKQDAGSKRKKGRGKSEIDDCPPQPDVASEEMEEVPMPVNCTVCGKTCESEQNLEMHMKYHSGDPHITCIECGKSFSDRFSLKRHLRIHVGIRPHICEYCGRGYLDSWSLRKHKSRGCTLVEVKVPAQFLHPCTQCTRVFSEPDHLDEHMKTHKGMLKFECDICQKKFSEAYNLKRHHRLHMAICPGCDKEFKDVHALAEHRANDCSVNVPETPTAEKEDGFPCPECGRVYTTNAYLERHKMFHSELRPYVCEICNKRFSEAFRLRRHIKVHNDKRPPICEVCRKRFTDRHSLKRHLASSLCSLGKVQQLQQEAVDFPCQLCDKIFTKNYLLARHMNVHSLDRPFACDVCGRTYKDISSLRRHQMIHEGVKRFVCQLCDKDFFYADSLRRHKAGSCGKKPKSRRRSKGRSQRRRSRKSNNNTSMKNNNDVGQEPVNTDPESQKVTTENPGSISQSPLITDMVYQTHLQARDVKVGLWSCHKRKQCWRCNLKFESTGLLLKHSRIHQHKKPYHCPHCFFRWSRKQFSRVHLASHKFNSGHRRSHTLMPTTAQPPVPKEKLKRSQRSISRARLPWISKL